VSKSPVPCLITNIRDWFETAKPDETRSVHDVQVQTGVHFEEIYEMIAEITPLSTETDVLLAKAKQAMKDLADHFKQSTDIVFIIDDDAHVNYLDSLCDQIVTAIGTAHFMGYDISPAVEEVDASNWSKFIDGQCIKDSNGKIAKGPDYFKANLKQFVV
jgi:predicted HAD superfamily Cof-like phosphohydrolase